MTYVLKLAVSIAAFVIVISQAHGSHNNVPEKCEAIYKENGAVPFSDTCFLDAATSKVGLGTYHCTASADIITEYCETLAHYDEDDEDDKDNAEDTTETDEGDSADADADADAEDTTSESNEEEVEEIIGADGNDSQCEYGLADYGTGACPDRPTLEEYDPNVGDGNNGCGNATDLLPNLPGPVAFTNQSLQLLDDVISSNLGNLASGISAANLVNALDDAKQTGEVSPVFEQIFDIVLPLLPGDNQVRRAFEDVAQYIEESNTGGCN